MEIPKNMLEPDMDFFESGPMHLAGRAVSQDSLKVDGIDMRDYPDFCDAYFTEGKYVDGAELSDDELQRLGLKYSEILWDMVVDIVQSQIHVG